MAKQVIETSLTPDCFVGDVLGDLRVKGWELPRIMVQADPDVLDFHEEEDTVRISCRGDLELRLPYGASLAVESVHGDAQIRLLDEPLKISAVHGDFNLRNVAGIECELVNGDFSSKNISGNLSIQQVLGDAAVHQVDGSCTLADVRGDLDLQNVRSDISVAAGGDIRLRLAAFFGEHYLIRASGDVHCSLPPDSSARLHLVSSGESIKVQLPGHAQSYRQKKVELALGQGEVEFSIEAGGDIHLMAEAPAWEGSAPDWTDYSEQISRQVEAQIGLQMEEVTRRTKEQIDRLSESLARSGMSPEETRQVVDQAMRTSEREAARAQEKMRRAQEKMERKIQEAQRKADQKARAAERSTWARSRHSWGRDYSSTPPPSPPPPPSAAVADSITEEERLMILRMLEQKKINLEEAEKLLSVLEGKE